MSRRRPSPEQRTLEYPTRRGLELNDLKDVRVSDCYAKLILLVLDLCIDHSRGYWDMSSEQLRKRCNEMARSTFYDRVARLEREGLLSRDPLPDGRRRWRICRSNLRDHVRHQGLAGTTAETSQESSQRWHQGPVDGRRPVHIADTPVHSMDTSVHQVDSPVHHMDTPVHQVDFTIYPTQSVPIRPPPPPSEARGSGAAVAAEVCDRGTVAVCADPEPTAASVIRSLAECGVQHPVPAVEEALSRGCSPSDMLAIVQHWRTRLRASGIGPAALQRRIARHSPGLPIEAGWPLPRTPPGTARAAPEDPEPRWGRKLDSLTRDELAELIRGADTTTQSMAGIVGIDRCRQSGDVRPRLLRLLAREGDP